jgi:hypothetical protein
MRKSILIASVILFANFVLNAQSQYIGLLGTCEDDYGKDVLFFPDGTKFILSITTGFDSPSRFDYGDIFITKLDSDNHYVWSKLYALTGKTYYRSNNYLKKYKQDILMANTSLTLIDTSGHVKWCNTYDGESISEVCVCKNQDILMTGFKTQASSSDRLFVSRIDSLGNVKWSRDFFGGAASRGESLIEMFDGSIIISGYIGGTSDYFAYKPALIKLDSMGNIIWMNYFFINGYDHTFHKTDHHSSVIVSEADTNLIINGTYKNGFDTNFQNTDKSYLFKVDYLTGKVIWVKTYNFSINDYTVGLLEYNDQLYLFGNDPYGLYPGFVIINTDLSGNINWSKSFGKSKLDMINNLVSFNNKLYIVGSVENFYGWRLSWTKYDSYLTEMGSDGNGTTVPGNNIIVITDSLTYFQANNDILSTTYDSEKTIISKTEIFINAILDTSLCSNFTKEIEYVNKEEVQILSNPNEGIFTIITNFNNYDIEVYNSMGKKILDHKMSNLNGNIDISSYGKGMYIVRISNIDNIVVKKILIL